VVIPEYAFVAFQMTFACITPALIVGAFAERIKFSALILFIVLWVTFVYLPIAHMVWWWPGPEAAATKPAEEIVAGAGLIWGSAPSTSPAAPWSTPMPASPGSSAA
jgi:Amt family ammonium transporter